MPKQPRRSRQAPPPGRHRRARRRAEPMLSKADVRTILHELATQIAPADVAALMSREPQLRTRAAALAAPGLTLLRKQLGLALDCLRDHVDGACPQIPYYTLTLLAAAVCYFSDEIDVVPDFLPRGQLDDAVVMAMACQLADAGLRRYCTWKGLPTAGILNHLAAASRRVEPTSR